MLGIAGAGLAGLGLYGMATGQGKSSEIAGPGYAFDQADRYDQYGNLVRTEDTQLSRERALQARDAQLEMAGRMRDRALGRGGPSIADLQLAQARDQNIRAYQAQVGAASGGVGAQMLAQRNAMAATGYAQQQTANQAAQARALEQAQADQNAISAYGQIRSADTQARELDEARQMGVAQNAVQMAGINAAIRNRNTANKSRENTATMASGSSMLGFGFSDARSKESTHASGKDVLSYADALARGKRTSPDRDATLGAVLAAIAEVNARIERIEKGRR